jgi:hypothetical protein
MEKETNLIMEHVFTSLPDSHWARWEKIFMDFESGNYIDTKTLQLVREKKVSSRGVLLEMT